MPSAAEPESEPEPEPGPGLLASLRRLGDDELASRLPELAGGERQLTARLVAHLAELDTRDLPLRAGYASLFVYCRDVLAVGEHDAYNRIEVARAARRFPAVLGFLHEGAVNLTTARLLETNDAHVGDTVRVMETRPLSKTKRWRVVEIVERAK